MGASRISVAILAARLVRVIKIGRTQRTQFLGLVKTPGLSLVRARPHKFGALGPLQTTAHAGFSVNLACVPTNDVAALPLRACRVAPTTSARQRYRRRGE